MVSIMSIWISYLPFFIYLFSHKTCIIYLLCVDYVKDKKLKNSGPKWISTSAIMILMKIIIA